MSNEAQLVIRLFVDGSVRAETKNIFGNVCLPFTEILEDLCDAEAAQSSYTQDYWITATQQISQQVEEHDNF